MVAQGLLVHLEHWNSAREFVGEDGTELELGQDDGNGIVQEAECVPHPEGL